MIRSLNGQVLDILDNLLILDVNGIGFEILCSRSVLNNCKTGENLRVITSMQISESGAVIYGFNSEQEREIFIRLTSIKGVGGKTGIAILSELSINEIVNAVTSADLNAFTRVSGVGRKMAERLCFELKNIAALKIIGGQDISSQEIIKSSGHADSVIDALLSLGFSRSDAGGVVNLLRAAHGEDFNSLSEEDLLRLALRELHK
ncbi:MAG: Holliday junction branch migration protein RuvA [Synergistaceae bacterium]|nr:Holliday junction branch migration protein RuvA [Synergistaceae bacterium]